MVVVLAGAVIGGRLWVRSRPGLQNDVSWSGRVTVPSAESTGTPEAKTETTGKTVEVTVEGSNYKFSPATIKAEKGDTVRLTFKSVGGIHDLTIDEFEVQTSQLGDEEEEETEFVADKTGTFEYYCSIAGHRAMGMKGQLIVE